MLVTCVSWAISKALLLTFQLQWINVGSVSTGLSDQQGTCSHTAPDGNTLWAPAFDRMTKYSSVHSHLWLYDNVVSDIVILSSDV